MATGEEKMNKYTFSHLLLTRLEVDIDKVN